MATRSLHLPVVIDIPEPCSEDWETLAGDERARHCERCTKHVHNLSVLTEDQIVELVARDNVCISLELDHKGEVISADSKRRPAGRASRVLVTAALTALAACGRGDRMNPGFNRMGGSPPVAAIPVAPTASAGPASSVTPATPSTAVADPVPVPSANLGKPMRLGGAPPIPRRLLPGRSVPPASGY